jgi:hypothetical protein
LSRPTRSSMWPSAITRISSAVTRKKRKIF